VVGGEYGLGNGMVLGVALADFEGRSSLGSNLGKADTSESHALVYATGRMHDLSLGAALGYGLVDIDTRRSIPVLGVESATADYKARAWTARLDASYAAARVDRFAIDPFASVQLTSVSVPGFQEANGSGRTAPELAVGERTERTGSVDLGARVSTSFANEGMPVSGFLSAAWRHYTSRDASFAGSFAGLPGSDFGITAARPAADAAILRLGFAVAITDTIAVNAQFDSALSEQGTAHSGMMRLGIRF